MARLARRGHRQSAARPRPATCSPGSWSARASKGVGVPAMVTTDYINTIPPEQEPWFPGDEVHRAPHPRVHPLERGGDGRPREPPLRRPRRPPLDVRVGRRALRGRLQPLLPRQGRRRLRRPGLLPGPRRARHLRPRVPRGPPDRGAARPLPPRGRRRRPAVVPAPAPPARRSGSSRRCRWGSARSTRSYQARFNRYLLHRELVDTSEGAGVVLRRRRRDGRARGDGRPVARGARAARQPDLRRQLQPAAARRSGARQRQDHPGVRGDVPRRGLERDQGDLGSAAGTSCSPATSTACSSTR